MQLTTLQYSRLKRISQGKHIEMDAGRELSAMGYCDFINGAWTLTAKGREALGDE